MKIGIFGGSFNPPHKMHLNIVEELLNEKILDKVIIVPTGLHYSYKNNLASNEHRYNMLKLMTKHNDKIEISDFEFKDEEIHSFDTLEYYKNIYKNDTIYFVCGLDNISYVDKWYKGEYLLNNYKFLVITRDTNNLDEILLKYEKYKDNIIITNIKSNNISSSYIRDELKEKNYNLNDYLDQKVIDYIKENNLYI
ncbi:MAG: nicotinate (nicotinamide) nucleotide adenylyltransferase [Bacilli bacterium]|nr:nicotinate (nicotinamide) nucleotide adenylyltransferase [Bacilli bacterium]